MQPYSNQFRLEWLFIREVNAVFDYALEGGRPKPDATVWSRHPLGGLCTCALTPFSGSVLTEIVGRALYEYYDKLGFQPPSRRRLVRQQYGYAYINLSALSRMEADQAGMEPPVLRFNGEPYPLAQEANHGILGGFKTSRNQKKIVARQSELGQGIGSTARTSAYWLKRIRDVQWTQADVLQVMEEVERTGVASMMTYLSARINLDLLYNRLIAALLNSTDYPESLSLINGAQGDMHSLVEMEIAGALVDIAADVSVDDDLVAWLRQDSFDGWDAHGQNGDSTPSRETLDALTAFLDIYGHRAVGEAEMAKQRW